MHEKKFFVRLRAVGDPDSYGSVVPPTSQANARLRPIPVEKLAFAVETNSSPGES
jgi:hypothetical protein